MTFKNSYGRIVVRTILLFVSLAATAFLLVKQYYLVLAFMVPVLIYQLVEFFKFQNWFEMTTLSPALLSSDYLHLQMLWASQ